MADLLGQMRRWFMPRTPAEYAGEVAAILLREGFDPKSVRDVGPGVAFEPGSRLFELPRVRGLGSRQAAEAIQLAANLFRARRVMAEAGGWPLKSEQFLAEGCARGEAYFLELLTDAIDQLGSDGSWVALRP